MSKTASRNTNREPSLFDAPSVAPAKSVAPPPPPPALENAAQILAAETVAPAAVPAAQVDGRFGQEEKHARIEAMTDQALADLGSALAAGRSERLTEYLTTMARFHSYSWGNVMLILIQAPHATLVAGFHTWRKLGRSVKKGEHGIMILAPVLRRVGELVEKKPDGTEDKRPLRQIVNTKPVYVFDVSQTDGKELPRLATISGEPAEHTTRIKDFIKGKGIKLEYAKDLGGALGVSHGGSISCLEGLSPAEEFHVLVHEVGHELLHRGDRRKETTKRSRELEAEAVAFVVCVGVGLDAKASSTDYIQLYQGDRDTLAESLQFIRSVSNEILTAVMPKQEGGTDA